VAPKQDRAGDWLYRYRVNSVKPQLGEDFFWMGNRLATQLLEVSDDPARLSEPGFWAVSTTFEGKWICARFGRVEPAPFPIFEEGWNGIAGEWESSFSRNDFMKYVDVIRDQIAQGMVYQVNACRQLSAPYVGKSLAPLMGCLLNQNPAPYSSYLRLPTIEIASASPELFLRLENGEITSGPIKGTKAPSEAGQSFSQKDVAENIMIVDLIRNDLGKICEFGSVSVPKLLSEQEHPGLTHLVSFVSGRVREGVTWTEIGEALLPPGSVSGAPKLSALQTIDAHENYDRGPYCGALGWVENGSALLSVAIRIFWTTHDGKLRFGTGAGITWGSDAQQEWEETELKAARLIGIAGGNSFGVST
jgi:para-aminobenzoate synthetase component 1